MILAHLQENTSESLKKTGAIRQWAHNQFTKLK